MSESPEQTVALEREILRTHISRQDFHKASQFISAAKACDNNIVREALLISALVCYSRPFSQTGMHAESTDRGLHDRLLALRGKALKEAYAEHQPVRLEASRRGKSSKMLFTPQRFSRSWSLLREDVDLKAFGRLVNEMHGRCSERLFVLSDQLAQAQPHLVGNDLI